MTTFLIWVHIVYFNISGTQSGVSAWGFDRSPLTIEQCLKVRNRPNLLNKMMNTEYTPPHIFDAVMCLPKGVKPWGLSDNDK